MKFLILLTMVMIICAIISTSEVFAMKISCAENIDLQEYPICQYVSEWNESEEFNEKVFAELTNRADEWNRIHTITQIYEEILEKVNAENPRLQEKSQNLKDWIFEQIKTD